MKYYLFIHLCLTFIIIIPWMFHRRHTLAVIAHCLIALNLSLIHVRLRSSNLLLPITIATINRSLLFDWVSIWLVLFWFLLSKRFFDLFVCIFKEIWKFIGRSFLLLFLNFLLQFLLIGLISIWLCFLLLYLNSLLLLLIDLGRRVSKLTFGISATFNTLIVCLIFSV